MDKNNKILLAVILLVFVTLLSFNLNSITGYQIKQSNDPYVSVSPKVARAGERLTVSVKTGALGINEDACLYDTNTRVACTTRACNGNYKCYSTNKQLIEFNFAPSTSLRPGVYSICVWDYLLADKKQRAGDNSYRRGHICGDFTIKE